MNDRIVVHGMVLSSTPVGEADRRLVILTGERGKITVFAKGARRPNSQLVAATRPFAYGEMTIYEGRNSYSLDFFDAQNFFEPVVTDLESSCYASYFTEFAGYYTREGLEAREVVRLLYASLLALEKAAIPSSLIKSIYELKLMAINGEYSEDPFVRESVMPAVKQAWDYVITSPLESLYKFSLEEKPLKEFTQAVDNLKEHFVDRNFKSLEILKSVIG